MGKLRFRPRMLAVVAVAPALALTPAVPAAPAAEPVARAKVADKARNALRVGGIAVSRKPRPGRLLPLSRSGRFPASTLTSILSSSLLQRPFTRACPAGQFIRGVTREGQVTCQAAADITGVTAGPGLRGGGTSGDVELSLAPPLRFELSSVPALLDLDNLGTGPAIMGVSRSSLATAFFRNLGTDEGQALKAETSSNSLGDAILAYARGATGFGVHAETINPVNPDAALYARSYGTGEAVRAEAEGAGDALRAAAERRSRALARACSRGTCASTAISRSRARSARRRPVSCAPAPRACSSLPVRATSPTASSAPTGAATPPSASRAGSRRRTSGSGTSSPRFTPSPGRWCGGR